MAQAHSMPARGARAPGIRTVQPYPVLKLARRRRGSPASGGAQRTSLPFGPARAHARQVSSAWCGNLFPMVPAASGVAMYLSPRSGRQIVQPRASARGDRAS